MFPGPNRISAIRRILPTVRPTAFLPFSTWSRVLRVSTSWSSTSTSASLIWREAAGITEWNLEVVAAFMRAAYGKGYCDALTEESPGSLCADHGYRVPHRPDHAHQSS